MGEALLGLAFLVTLAAQPAGDDVAKAKRAEASAFEAIEGERWCDAARHFREANAAAPSVDLTYNAAQAADLAEDRKQALQLYVELAGAYPGSDRQTQVNERIQELTALIAEEGEGTACPVVTTDAEEPAEVPGDDADVLAEPSVVEPPPEDGAALDVLPWAVVGSGGALVALGAGLTAIGALPYVGFLDARAQILELERTGGDATALQKQQADARAGWESWGELTVLAGVTAAVTGALVATGGLLWAITSGTPDEDPDGTVP